MTPPIIEGKKAELDGILQAAELMLVTARTAPKTGGRDDVLTLLVDGEEKEAIADEMEEITKEKEIRIYFERDAKNVRDSEAVVLVGVRGNKSYGLDCGACGYDKCSEFEKSQKKLGKYFTGPTCLFKALDLGIALGSAAKMASLLNIDNRIMVTIGTAALRLNLLPEATTIIGMPMSAKGKNIYFDRK